MGKEQGKVHICLKAVVNRRTFPGKFDQTFLMIIVEIPSQANQNVAVSVVYYKPNDNMSNDTCCH